MKIIILGAGEVGKVIAENLISRKNDITIIDKNINSLNSLQVKFDLKVVNGCGSYPRILKEAGAENADMLIAVTNSDEVNMIACHISHLLFNIPNKVARVRAFEYIKRKNELFSSNKIAIDYLIFPEQIVVNYIKKIIQYPGVLQVINFNNDKVSLVATKVFNSGLLIGNSISNLQEHLSNIDFRITAIFRHNMAIQPRGSTIIELGDEVFFVVKKEHIFFVMSKFQCLEKPYKNIMINGGSNIGACLAKELEKKYYIKLIEKDKKRALDLSNFLSETVVFCGDCSDKDFLVEESIDQIDVFIALTNDDEVNIMSALLAKRMGVKKTIILINRSAYVDLVQQSNSIDIAISPQQATISDLLGYIKKSDIINFSPLRKDIVDIIEVIVCGNKNINSKFLYKKISDINLPSGTVIGAIVRDKEIIIVKNEDTIKENDHIIMFVTNKDDILEIERIFKSNLLFL